MSACLLTSILCHGRNVFREQQHGNGLGVVALGRGTQLQQLLELVHPCIAQRLGARRQQPGCRFKLDQHVSILFCQAWVSLCTEEGLACGSSI